MFERLLQISQGNLYFGIEIADKHYLRTPIMRLLISTTFVKALFFALSLSACRKNDSAKPTISSKTSGMGGVRHWQGSHYYDASGIHFPTPVHEFYYYPDTSFALTVVDDTTIDFMGHTYQYTRTDTPAQIYFFGTAYYYYQYGMGNGVAYYYSKDSIVYCQGDRHGTSDQWTLRNLRYTY
jgi:hypothetical protein